MSGQAKAGATNLTAAAWTVNGGAAGGTNAAAGDNLTNTTNANVTSVTISGTGYVANSGGYGINAGTGNIGEITVTGSGNGNVAISGTSSAVHINAATASTTINNTGSPATTITSSDTKTVNLVTTTAGVGFTLNQGNTAGTTGGTISNTRTTDSSSAVWVETTTGNQTVNNYKGLITGASGTVNPAALTMNANGGNISVTNGSESAGVSGTISSTGIGKAIHFGNLGAGTITLINKQGSITSTGTAANLGAIRITQAATSGVTTITNSGTISNTRSTSGGSAIYSSSSAGSGGFNITNNAGGSITTATTGVAAIRASNVHGVSTITNSGTITGAGTTGAGGNAIAIDNSANTTQTTINLQSGSITNGALKLGTGGVSQDIVNLNGGTLNGDIVAAFPDKGTVNVTANTSSNGNIGTTNALNSLSITGGVLTLNNNVNATTTSNSATLAISSGNTSTITGNYTQAAAGTFRTGLTSNTGFGKLVVTGTATLQNNAKIDVNVVGAPSLTVGTTLASVISATTTLNSDGTYAVTDNSALFNFTAAMNDKAVDLTITKGTTAASATAGSGNAAASGAAAVFDTLIGSSGVSAEMSSVITKLGELSTSQQVSDAISQTLPLLSGGSQAAASTALTGINRVVQARIESNRGLSSGDTFYGDEKFWMKPFGSWADQNDRKGVSGFKSRTGGIAFGADATVSDTTRLGLSFAYAKADVVGNSTTAPNSAYVDIYQLIGYGSRSLDADTEISFQAGVGMNKNDGQRSILFTGTTAKAKYDSVTATAGIGIARSYPLSQTTSFIPSVRADYTRIKDKGYTETGAGALNLNVQGHTSDELILAVDGKLSHQYDSGTTVTANLGAGYDALSDQASITAAYAGAAGSSFVTKGLDPSPWMVRAGVGVARTMQSGMEILARYDAEKRSDFLNQTASVKLRWAF